MPKTLNSYPWIVIGCPGYYAAALYKISKDGVVSRIWYYPSSNSSFVYINVAQSTSNTVTITQTMTAGNVPFYFVGFYAV